MPTASELTVAEELAQLHEVAEINTEWTVTSLGTTSFVLGVPRKGGGALWVLCEADQYPTLPPIWKWCGPAASGVDMPEFVAVDGSPFFHGNGVICAPWNRLAYAAIDPRGPHNDWAIGDWKSNPETKECTTLAAMAIRISVEALTRFAKTKNQV